MVPFTLGAAVLNSGAVEAYWPPPACSCRIGSVAKFCPFAV
jgi:hypothetical protein